MKTTNKNLLLLSGLLLTVSCFIGCSGEPESTPAPTKGAAATTGAGAGETGKKTGSVMNTDVVPAPAGAKTGTEGGQK